MLIIYYIFIIAKYQITKGEDRNFSQNLSRAGCGIARSKQFFDDIYNEAICSFDFLKVSQYTIHIIGLRKE